MRPSETGCLGRIVFVDFNFNTVTTAKSFDRVHCVVPESSLGRFSTACMTSRGESTKPSSGNDVIGNLKIRAHLSLESASKDSSSWFIRYSLGYPSDKIVVEGDILDAIEGDSNSCEVEDDIAREVDILRVPYLDSPAESMVDGAVRY